MELVMVFIFECEDADLGNWFNLNFVLIEENNVG